MKIGLGTVQFGLDYGISNGRGRTGSVEVARILEVARAHGIQVLDTAPAYGASEAVLGACRAARSGFRIVTKTPKFDQAADPVENADALERSLRASLEKLATTSVYGLLFHRASDLRSARGELLMDRARACRSAGLVEKVGVSVYDAEEIDALEGLNGIDIVQVPINVLDQRLLASGHLEKLKARSVEIHARSVFLQGLLLMEPEALPPALAKARRPLEAFRAAARDRSLSPLDAALGFVLSIPHVDVALCGVNDADQLEAICKRTSTVTPAEFAGLATTDASILNPSQWSASQ
jgi:aryl-alcohol dehydrogenase-like predicted oxidoreductase